MGQGTFRREKWRQAYVGKVSNIHHFLLYEPACDLGICANISE